MAVLTFSHGEDYSLNNELLGSLQECLKQRKNIMLTGLSGSAKTFVISRLAAGRKGKTLCLVADEERAYDLVRDLSPFIDKNSITLFLARDFVFLKENTTYTEAQRILSLQELLLHPRKAGFIITTPGGLLHRIMSPAQMQAGILSIETGQELDYQQVLVKLVNNGYTRVNTVTRPGEMAIRGGILDIFAMAADHPYRIELFGDTVDSIHRFDINTQRSTSGENKIIVLPADELSGEHLEATIFDYIGGDAWLFWDEPREFNKAFARSSKRYKEFTREALKKEKRFRDIPILDQDLLSTLITSLPIVYHSFFPGNIPQASVARLEHIAQQEMEHFHNQYEALFSRLKEWQEKNYTIQIAAKNKKALQRLRQELSDHHITGIDIVDKTIENGFVSQTLKMALLSEQDIWGKRVGKRTKKPARIEQRLLVEDLKLGDYVVHENYGIGVYHGVTQVETDGVTREYILLQYAGTDKLYLPVDKLDLLHRYTTSEEKQPRLSKLGGTEWDRTRKKVADSIQEMAEELLNLYATRESIKGFSFSPDTPWQQEFEDSFPFQETPDQLKAIQEVKRDMEKSRPMDRLVCGDVGYGKTEVAMRAAFKAVMDGKQVAILVPTTVLAEQHYETFSARFQDYPTTVEVLSRFKSGARQKEVLEDLQKGAIDIIVGTHRLLSKDVQFKDLGLLIIDEEHRFGVAQKEKIKAFKNNVDVLSLSATPIPRSLHMSLTGLRDLTVIETPPPERYPVTTYVLEYNEEVIREAVRAEIERDGQVFFVHNRIHDIYQVQEKLSQLLPGVSIGVGHGRMREEELSRVMIDFVKGKYQVFLCTTIIESGLDMPNVNTIIVDEADKMGLAQLYQLRGRVGRSNRMAYAYLTYRPDRVITEAAGKRLNAIREFNEMGAGMKIALRDLEIRGAGNILGPEQHGYIQAVGFDLYCRLLEQQTAQLKGQTAQTEVNPQVDIDVDYYIPETYIPDAGTKMRFYRRLLLAREQEEIDDIQEEMLDRFGTLPAPVENFLQIARLRIRARDKEIKGLRRKGQQMEIQLATSLPSDFLNRTGHLRVRKLNDDTFTIQLGAGTSIKDLEQVINSI